MADALTVRRLALALPGTVEQDHHRRPSFRVAGRIFATTWDPKHVNVMLDEAGIRTAVEREPGICEEVRWGRRLSAVRLDLRSASADLIAELLADAWESKAPERLVTEHYAGANSSRARKSHAQPESPHFRRPGRLVRRSVVGGADPPG